LGGEREPFNSNIRGKRKLVERGDEPGRTSRRGKEGEKDGGGEKKAYQYKDPLE